MVLERQVETARDFVRRCNALLASTDRRTNVEQIHSDEIVAWKASADRLIASMFGENSPELLRFAELYDVDRRELLDDLSARGVIDWDIRYWIVYFNNAITMMNEFDAVHSLRSPAEKIDPTEVVRNTFNLHNSQLGAVAIGSQNTVSDNTFTQDWRQLEASVDLGQLARELAVLREAAKQEASSSEDFLELGQIALAEKEAAVGKGPEAMAALSRAGRWALALAEKVGTPVAVSVLTKALGA